MPDSRLGLSAEEIAASDPTGGIHDIGAIFDRVGYTGLNRSGGRIHEELHRRLSGGRAARVYAEMRDNDPVIGAVLYLVESLLLSVSWRIDPADDSAEAERWREVVQGEFDRITWPDVLCESISMIPFGWSLMETMYRRRPDGLVGWESFEPRGQDSLEEWIYDEHDRVVGMRQSVTSPIFATPTIPLWKTLHFTTRSIKKNPEGRSMLRNAYRPWYFSKRLEEIEAIGIERDLAGLPKVSLPERMMSTNATASEQANRAAYLAQAQKIRNDERACVVMPSKLDKDGKPTGYDFELISSGGRRAIDVSGAIERHDKRKAMPLLAQFIFLGMDQVGSFALASSQTNLFGYALNAILGRVASVFNSQGIGRLMTLNGVSEELWPTLAHADVEAPDLEVVAKYLDSMIRSGTITPDEPLEDHLRELAKLPPADPDTRMGATADFSGLAAETPDNDA